MIDLKIDAVRIADQIAALGNEAPRAIVRALNRTIASVRTLVIREIADDTGLANKDIRPSIGVTNATFSRPAARLVVTGRRIPLIAFDARQTLRGVTYIGRRGRGEIRGAFIATMASGHRGVFKRRGVARLPIDELKGPSLPFVMTKRWSRAMTMRANELLQANAQHEVTFLLRGQRITEQLSETA